VHDAVARDARIVALEHGVADRARRTRSPRDDRDESVARDAARGDRPHDLIHATRPRIHARILA